MRLLFSFLILSFSHACLAEHATKAKEGYETDPEVGVRARALFCEDPYAFVCRNKEGANDTTVAFNTRFKTEALKAVAEKFKNVTNPGVDKALRQLEKTTSTVSFENEEELRLFLTVVREYLIALEKVAPFKRKELEAYFAELRGIQGRAIEQHPGITPEQKAEMKKRLSQFAIQSFAQVLDSIPVKVSVLGNETEIQVPAQWQSYLRMCWPDGMKFAGKYSTAALEYDYRTPEGDLKKESVVATFLLLCPGALLSMADPRPGKAPEGLSYDTTLGHEFAHSYDAAKMPEVYTKWQACLEEVYGQDPDLKWCQDHLKSREPQVLTKEFSADYWSAETMAVLLKDSDPNFAFEMVRRSTQKYCGETDILKNAPEYGRFRIRLIGNNPRLRKVLGCEAPTPAKPLCGLEGKLVGP